MSNHVLAFVGSKTGGCRTLNELLKSELGALLKVVITVDDTNDPRTALPEISALCRSYQKSLHILSHGNQMEEVVRDEGITCIVLHGWYLLLSKLFVEERIVLAFHYSSLPSYRGHAPVVWQLLNGESSVGVSLFRVTGEMDRGPIIARRDILIEQDEYIGDVLKKCDAEAKAIVRKELVQFLKGTLHAEPQDESFASYGCKRNKLDARIRWEKTAEEVILHIRAQSKPYPESFTYHGNTRVEILEGVVFPNRVFGQPGRVAFYSNQSAVIACGHKTAIEVTRIMEDDNVGEPKAIWSGKLLQLE